MDSIQTLLPAESGPLLLLLPVDVQISAPEEEQNSEVEQVAATREELFAEISKGGGQIQRGIVVTPGSINGGLFEPDLDRRRILIEGQLARVEYKSGLCVQIAI